MCNSVRFIYKSITFIDFDILKSDLLQCYEKRDTSKLGIYIFIRIFAISVKITLYIPFSKVNLMVWTL